MKLIYVGADPEGAAQFTVVDGSGARVIRVPVGGTVVVEAGKVLQPRLTLVVE